jgi:hypothetical protein
MNYASHLNPVILTTVAAIVLFLCFFYITKYQIPADSISKKLDKINKALAELGNEDSEAHRLNQLDKIFDEKPFFDLWSEYKRSLHTLESQDGLLSAVRATTSAEFYFTKESIVDVNVNADFFKHLPGILTGVGIIGTFSGLVWGLSKFNPNNAIGTLAPLLGEVTSAFIGSGIAILFAIVITIFEKQILNQCYKSVEELNKLLDGLYSGGVGEDYLARLVIAAESSATHAASLKDALMRDLEELMNKQAGQIGTAIAQSLQGPMDRISGAVEKASGQQGEAVSGLLDNLMTAFMAKIDETFGSQIKGINEAIQKSSDSMITVQDAMTKLIDDISNAGQNAATDMSKKMEESMDRAALAQENMNNQLREFINELKRLFVEQQVEAKDAMNETMRSVMEELQKAINSIAEERGKQIDQDAKRTEDLTASTQNLYAGLSDSVTKLVEDIKDSVIKTEQNITAIQNVATDAIGGMNTGAVNMRNAADKFTDAGNAVVNVLDQSKNITVQMQTAANSLESTTAVVRDLFNKYEESRQANLGYVAELTNLIATAKREAGVSQQIVADMERIIGSLGAAEQASTVYLDKVNDVLKQSFETFNGEMLAAVSKMNKENDDLTSSAIGALSSAVEVMVASTLKLRKDN